MKILSILMMVIFSFSVWASRVEVDVLGMTCGMCIEAITKELKGTDKVENIQVSLEEKKTRFEVIKTKTISDAEIRAAIKRAGYEALKVKRHK